MASTCSLIRQIITQVLLALILLYRYLISPLLGPRCRFYPSCSQYALEAIQQQGIIKGLFLAIKRLLRCNPFNPGGVDLVPNNTKLIKRK